MARGLLCLGFVLLGVLQAQAQDFLISPIPAPPLVKIPLQPDFREDQFQGKWYVIGIAGNSINATRRAQFKMYTTTYELKDDHSYNVTSTLIRNESCDHWIRTFVPNLLPGQFTLGNIKSYAGMQSYTVRVMITNYNQFAMVFFKKVHDNQEFFKITLYGRTKQLSTDLKEYFTRFAKSLGLTDNHIIFPVPIGTSPRLRGGQDPAEKQAEGLVSKQACGWASMATSGEWESPRSVCPLASLPIPCPHHPLLCCIILEGNPQIFCGWARQGPRASQGKYRGPGGQGSPHTPLPMLTTLSPADECIDDE